MQAEILSENMVRIYQPTWHHIPHDANIYRRVHSFRHQTLIDRFTVKLIYSLKAFLLFYVCLANCIQTSSGAQPVFYPTDKGCFLAVKQTELYAVHLPAVLVKRLGMPGALPLLATACLCYDV
jgi:hypothetical protein